MKKLEPWLEDYLKEKKYDCVLFKANIPEFKNIELEVIEKLYSNYSHETACAGWLSINYNDPKPFVEDFREWATKSPLQIMMENQDEDTIA